MTGVDGAATACAFGAYVALLRVEFEVGNGAAAPGQLAFVTLLFVFPAGAVPLVVAAAHVLVRTPELVRREVSARRAFHATADAWFAVGPALVLLGSSEHGPTVPLVAAALVAQIAVDTVVVALRLGVGLRLPVREQIPSIAWIYILDAFLTPIAALAAADTADHPAAVLAVLPLAGLMRLYAGERRQRIDGALKLHNVALEGQQRLQAILEHAADLVAIVDRTGSVVSLSGATADLWGDDWQAPAGALLADRAHPSDRAAVAALLADVTAAGADVSYTTRWRMLAPDGSWRQVEGTAVNLLDEPTVAGVAVTVRDIETQARFEAQLRHRAFHDPLTSLPNAALFDDRLEQALVGDGQVAVLLIDLNELQRINVAHGRDTGDAVLATLAGRLRSSLRTGDTGARVRGGTFAALLTDVRASDEPLGVAERIREAASAPMDGIDALVGVSVGLVTGDATSTADDLRRRAEVALRAAKRRGGLAVWSPELDQTGDAVPAEVHEETRERILSVLDSAEALQIVYQPILDLRSGTVAGYEALARFHAGDTRPPNLWFADAHRCGLGPALEAYALAAALSAPGRPDATYLAVNVSPSAIGSREVAAVLPRDLTGVIVEVTENELVSGGEAMGELLGELRARGAQLAVDDTGAGYAGLQQLVRLQPDLIKLDRALVIDVHEQPVKAALILSLVRYAANIGARVCAEGIETLDELRCLADLGVEYGQGWAIARPGAPWVAAAPDAVELCAVAREGAGAWVPGEQLNIVCARLGAADTLDAVADAVAPLLAVMRADGVTFSSAVGVRSVGVTTGTPIRLPLVCGGAPVGTLEAFRHDGNSFNRREIERGEIAAAQLAATLERIGRGAVVHAA